LGITVPESILLRAQVSAVTASSRRSVDEVMQANSIEATVERLRRLLVLAEQLKRSNLAKLIFDQQDWHAAVTACGILQLPPLPKDDRIGRLLRRARNIARRLGSAGDARFGSYNVGRDPDSSTAGKRFHQDLNAAHEVLRELETLCDPAQ
jgi:hypothetical protein